MAASDPVLSQPSALQPPAVPDDGPLDVVAVGSAIVDAMAQVDHDALDGLGIAPGSMTLVEAEEARRLWDGVDGRQVAGGSAANTVVGVASLGGRAAFVGRLGDDELGAMFADDLRAQGVVFEAPPPARGVLTGRSVVFVTPDGERTMRTHLGAGPLLDEGCVSESLVRRASVVYLEGYLWDAPDAAPALARAVAVAAAAGARVSLSLSDAGCVERHHDEFRRLVTDGSVDVVFANEAEALTLTDAASLDDAADRLRGTCEIAALTRGELGSVVVTAEGVRAVPAQTTTVVDTTGAGDLYAAGFLVGLCRGLDLETCARLGGLAAAEVISVLGARPPRRLRSVAEIAGLL